LNVRRRQRCPSSGGTAVEGRKEGRETGGPAPLDVVADCDDEARERSPTTMHQDDRKKGQAKIAGEDGERKGEEEAGRAKWKEGGGGVGRLVEQ
jgi:hypothetical protein